MIETSLDPRAVADYFFYGYVPDPKSIYRGVAKLPPGHTLIAGPGSPPRIERYWRPVFTHGGGVPFADAAEMLRRKVDDAVAAQMMSDVPLGAFLSGGVDSAGIVSSMAQTGNKLVACTIGFDEESHDERAAARSVAAKFGAVYHEGLASSDSAQLVDQVASAFGEPFADASALPSYQVAQIARRHVTVALSGDGGDELFAGYRRYPFFLAEERMRALAPHALRAAIFGPLGALYPKLDWAPRPLRAKTTLQALAQSSAHGYAAAAAINLPQRIAGVLNPDLARRLGEAFVARRKLGFAPPLTAWMRRDKDNPALRLNASRHWRESGMFNEKAVDEMVSSHRSGAADCAQELWSVIMFDAFLRTARR